MKAKFEKLTLILTAVIGFILWMRFPTTVEQDLNWDLSGNLAGLGLFGISLSLLSLIREEEKSKNKDQ